MSGMRRRRGRPMGASSGGVVAGASEVTNLTINSQAGVQGITRMNFSDMGFNQLQQVQFDGIDTVTVNGEYVYCWQAGQQQVFWFNQGREQVHCDIGDGGLNYGLFDFSQAGLVDIWTTSSDANFFQGFINDGLGNFTASGVNYTAMDSFGSALQFHLYASGGQVFIRSTLDGDDIYDCEIFTDGTTGSFAFVASSGYVHVAPVLSGNLDGSGGTDAIDSFDGQFFIINLHLTRYGPASASGPGISATEHEVGYRSTDTIAQIISRLTDMINARIGGATYYAVNPSVTVDSQNYGFNDDPGVSSTSFNAFTNAYGSAQNYGNGDYFVVYADEAQSGVQIPVSVAFWINVDGAGSSPGIGATYEYSIDCSSGASGADMASNLYSVITLDSVLPTLFTPTNTGEAIEFTTVIPYLSYIESTSGGLYPEIVNYGTEQDFSAGRVLLNTTTTNYYLWFRVGSLIGIDPAIAGRTGLQVNIAFEDSTTTIATAVKNKINTTLTMTATNPSPTVARVTNVATGNTTNNSSNMASASLALSIFQQGS